MTARRFRFGLPVFIALLLLTVLLTPGRVHAEWPPFRFDLIPSHEDGKVSYAIGFYTDVDWMMADLTFKILVPPGTRFLRAVADPGIEVDLDGEEVTVFATIIDGNIPDVRLEFEVTDETATVITAHAWISWKGDHPGDYLTDDVSIDLTGKPLKWEEPWTSFLDLSASAVVEDDVVTYSIYPSNDGWLRMWDLKINVPLPEGTTFLSAEAPAPFVTDFDGREISFFTLELAEGVDVDPLRFKVSTQGMTDGFAVTRVYAFWKNEGWGVGTLYAVEGQVSTGNLTIRPGVTQMVVADVPDDVPLPHTDLTSVAFAPEVNALEVIFSTVGDPVKEKDPTDFSLYIDADCNPDTGDPIEGFGIEYRAGVEPIQEESYFEVWDTQASDWRFVMPIRGHKPAAENNIHMWIPLDALSVNGPLCWVAETASWNLTNYDPYPASDTITSNQYTQIDLARWASVTPALPPTDDGIAEYPTTPLDIEASAFVQGASIIYTVYPRNISAWPIQDLSIDLPLPAGTTLSSIEVPPSFTATAASLDGYIFFKTAELPQEVEIAPLRAEVWTHNGSDSQLTTRVSAQWKGVRSDAGTLYPVEGQVATGNLTVHPGFTQMVVADVLDDVPLPHTDLTSVAFVPEVNALEVIFSTVGDAVKEEDPTGFFLFIDADCNPDTGDPIEGFGSEYRAGVEPGSKASHFEVWDTQVSDWRIVKSISAHKPPTENKTHMWIPLDALPANEPLCWVAQTTTWHSENADTALPADSIKSNQYTLIDVVRWAEGTVR